MHFARDILVRAVKTDMDYQELQDALSLMGYDDPTTSPCGQMMSQHVSACTLTLRLSYPPVTSHLLSDPGSGQQHVDDSAAIAVCMGTPE